jgi:hypothetical protein
LIYLLTYSTEIESCHSRVSGNPELMRRAHVKNWIPADAGMTKLFLG